MNLFRGALFRRSLLMRQPSTGYLQSPIRSLQRFTVAMGTTPTTQAITAVDMPNTLLRVCGSATTGTGHNVNDAWCRVAFTNATTLTFTKGGSQGVGNMCVEVVEFWPGLIRQIQRGTIAMAGGGSSNTYTISPVVQDTLKAWVDCLGTEGTYSGTSDGAPGQVRVAITSTSQVTATRIATDDATTTGIQVVEWW